MFAGVALALSELPTALVARHDLGGRVHERGGEAEVRFLFRERERLLPVWLDGRLEVVTWGARRGDPGGLPCTGWTWLATVESGWWAGAEAVVVPATLGLAGGVWYRIREGVRGVAVRDPAGRPRVYVICEPASHYFRTMTRCEWMPALVNERY